MLLNTFLTSFRANLSYSLAIKRGSRNARPFIKNDAEGLSISSQAGADELKIRLLKLFTLRGTKSTFFPCNLPPFTKPHRSPPPKKEENRQIISQGLVQHICFCYKHVLAGLTIVGHNYNQRPKPNCS